MRLLADENIPYLAIAESTPSICDEMSCFLRRMKGAFC